MRDRSDRETQPDNGEKAADCFPREAIYAIQVSRRATGPCLSPAPHLSSWKSISSLAFISATAFPNALGQIPKPLSAQSASHLLLPLFLASLRQCDASRKLPFILHCARTKEHGTAAALLAFLP